MPTYKVVFPRQPRPGRPTVYYLTTHRTTRQAIADLMEKTYGIRPDEKLMEQIK